MKIALFLVISSSFAWTNQEKPLLNLAKPSTTPASPTQPSQPEARPETSVKAPDFHNEVRAILETSCVLSRRE